MLVGYVSDERYVAVADALLEFRQDGKTVAESRSSARGAVHADLAPGTYQVTLVRDGFGSKVVTVDLDPERPHHFRLLADGLLLGYMWPKWVKSGERAEFRVHSVEAYKLSLWRYGLRKEYVKTIGWYDEHGPRAVMQVTPDGDYTQTGVQWNKQGYGSPSHTQFVVAPERSGLYYLHAETASGKFFAFPWVVAPATPSAPLAVLASTNTWNAYNNFGGRSNYVNLAGLPPEPIVNARLEMRRYQEASSFNESQPPDEAYVPLSFERPEPFNHVPKETRVTDVIAGRQSNHLAPAEWRLLGWLEREGYAYDLYSEAQLHDGTLDLDAYKTLIISVHPEYWSRPMYLKVKEWVRERGGHFLYLGGNGINCEVEFISDSAIRFFSHQPPNAGTFRYTDLATGRTIDSRFHRRFESEANLLGVAMTSSGIMTAAPYKAINANHWIFAGTGLHDGDLFGQASLHERCPGGASGHETDKMSASTPPGTLLLAKGTNPDDGGAEMVYYETASGGAVFSVGSITYPASILVDPAISRITANVLDAFLGEHRPAKASVPASQSRSAVSGMRRLQDRVCLVTGAGRGIGLGIARRFLDEGARVWICDVRPESLPTAIADLAAHGPVDGSVTDVGKRDQCQAMFDAIIAKWGRIDVVVNNAGGSRSAAFVDVTDEDWDYILDMNLRGAFHCSQIGARLMIAQGGGGSIINIGSTNGLRGQPALSPYGAAKAGIINLSMSAALELGEHGIRVNALCPGTVLSHGEPEDRSDPHQNQLRAHTALDRLGRPADIAAVAAFLASDDAAFVTGQAIVADGGLTARQLTIAKEDLLARAGSRQQPKPAGGTP